MKRWRIPLYVVCALVTGVGFFVASPASASDEGQEAAAQVSLSSYQDFLNTWLYTHTGHNRGPNGAQHIPARDNIKALMESYGLSVQFDTFTYSGKQHENVVGTKLGTLYPNSYFIIGGHYDSVNNPGADDNASGVAAVLEAARIISQYPSDYTIRFIAFDMEEAGLIGSDHYATLHASDDIRGMISLDMVCYDPNTNMCRIYGRSASNPIKNALAAAVAEYSGGLTVTMGGQLDASDHAPFEDQGFQACLLIEQEVWNNPYYHTQQDCYDTPNYLNFAYAVKLTRATVGWLVDAAGVDVPVNTLKFTYPDGLPEYAFPDGSTRIRVVVTGVGTAIPQPGTGLLHYRLGTGAWQVVPMEAVSDNVYDTHLPAATCGTGISYYFSAQAVGGGVYKDPRQAPDETYAAKSAYGLLVAYENPLDANPGWTTQGQWAFGHPTGKGGTQHGYPDPNNGYTGTNVYGVNLNGDYSTTPGGPYYVTTGPISVAGLPQVRLKFRRWLNTDYEPYVYATIHASSNGSTWTKIWSNGSSEIVQNSWSLEEFDLSAITGGQPTVYLRWGYQIGSGAWAYSGWNIDDIQLTALDCEAPYTPGDLNCDGDVDFSDINPFVLALSGQALYEQQYPDCYWLNGDIDGNGTVNFSDINPFVDLLSG